jgi:hypothetical protein
MEQEVAVTTLSSGAPGGAVAEVLDAGAGRRAAGGRAAAYRPRALR